MRQRGQPVRGSSGARGAGTGRKPGTPQVEVVTRPGLSGYLGPRDQRLLAGQRPWPLNGHAGRTVWPWTRTGDDLPEGELLSGEPSRARLGSLPSRARPTSLVVVVVVVELRAQIVPEDVPADLPPLAGARLLVEAE